MSTLAVVEEILHEASVPLSVREIVERAGPRLPSKSKTPDTVVARDLAMDIKKHGNESLFVRTSPGRYSLRALCSPEQLSERGAESLASRPEIGAAGYGSGTSPVAVESAMERMQGVGLARKPAVASGTPRPASTRDSAEGGGYAG
jgi:hypothetical protein